MRRRTAHMCAAALAVITCLASPLAAQDGPTLAPATLIADNIRFDGASAVTARGAVEVFFQGTRLRAQSITYDGASGNLSVAGPLTLTDAGGNQVIFAEFAELSEDLQNGVLQSARLVLNRELQIAATQIDRTGGRFTQLYQAVASTCEICFENPTPLWEIRARRVIHDAEEQQLYFERAQLRVVGVPVFFVPRLRLPDPTLDRSTGFLAPSVRVDDQTGTSLQAPYFIELGDHADLTLTPWIGLGDSQTLEARYRHLFRRGGLNINAAVTTDELTEDDYRYYVFADANFALGGDFRLVAQLQAVSDRGYLATYDFLDPDILESFVRVSQVSRYSFIEVGGTIYESLRAGEVNAVLPTHVVSGEISRRYSPDLIGGTLTAELDAMGLYRTSDISAEGHGDTGRDVARLAGMLDWRRTEVFGGLAVTFEGAVHGAFYNIDQGGSLTGTATRITPYAAVELRYPLQAIDASGTSHVIEPVAQLVWSDTFGDEVPNEDSFIVEFDEANLFSLDRFPGSDAREIGPRANLGLTYSRVAPSGFTFSVAGGIVLRPEDQGQFTGGSGLNGMQSDFLVASHVSLGSRFGLINRSLFDTSLSFTSSELSLYYRGERVSLSTSYTFLEADLGEQRPEDLSEWIMSTNYNFGSGWSANANWRYDFDDETPTRAGLTLGYANECVDMAFSVSRRYTNSVDVEPTTNFDFTVSLVGFGTGRDGRSVARTCRG